MNYHKIYQQLVSKRQTTLTEGYTEKHHIVPKCMKGTDELENLVSLTAREHFIAHQLLVKMFPKNYGLVCAARWMSNNKKYSSKRYEWLKIEYSNLLTGMPKSDIHRMNLSLANLGKVRTEESKLKQSLSVAGSGNHYYGKKHTPEIIEKIKEKRSKQIVVISDDHKRKLSIAKKGKPIPALQGRKLSEEHKKKITGRPKKIKD